MNLSCSLPSLHQIKATCRQAFVSSWQQAGEGIQTAQVRLRQAQQSLSTGIHHRVTVIRQNVQQAQSTLQGRVRHACQVVNQTCQQGIRRIQQFTCDHKMTFILLGCSALTAYVSPVLFTATFLISIIATVEIDRRINQYANQRLAAANANTYPPIIPHGNPGHTGILEMTLGTVSATHAILISTFFLPASLTVMALPPMLGAAAAGHVCAKAGLDQARYYSLIQN